MKLIGLAFKQLRRDARASELRVLFWALLIAVAASCAIGFFSARLNAAMELRASEFLAADLRLSGSAPATAAQLQAGLNLDLHSAQVVEFASMVATEQAMQLASIKAVDDAYPLRGALRSAANAFAEERSGGRPQPGEVWLESRLLTALDIDIGDQIEVGQLALTVRRVLTYEPDRAGDFYSMTPRVLMHINDLAATGVVQPGSRVSYKLLWQGNTPALTAYRQAIAAELLPAQRLEDARDGNRQVGSALDRAERYLHLASLAAILLAAVAVALCAARFATKRYDSAALLRCFGLSRRQTLALFGWQLAMLGLLACLSGAALGWFAQLSLFYLLKDLLPEQIPAAGMGPAFTGMATGMIALAGFALPPLAALGTMAPLRVLRRDLLPQPMSIWLVYACALLALGSIMWRLSLDLKLTLGLLGGGLIACFILATVLWLSLRSLRQVLTQAPLAWRLGLGQLLRHPLAAAGQTLAFGLILMAMALIALVRTELLDAWQSQLPAQAPNHFALNVLPDQQQAFSQQLAQLSVSSAPLYPIVAGRLTHINDQPVQTLVSKESRGERAIERDLSLTWSTQLPADNRLKAGHWWQTAEPAGVSVEAKLAQSLGLQLGDKLRFNIAGQSREATVQSLREVQWDNFQPNFYMIFSPEVLQDLPYTYLTSFYLAPEQESQLLQLARAFPASTILQVDALLKQLRSIMAQVSLAIEFVLLFVLAAGVVVLFAGLQATLDERIRQGALLRALGASRKLVQGARSSEFVILGALSGLFAALGCELASFGLYRYALDIPWQPHPWLLLLPIMGAIVVSLAGLWGTRQALQASPLSLLRG